MTTDATPGALGSNAGLGLLERLRQRREFISTDGARWYMVDQPDADCQQAAEEIESLRAALKWYADGEHFGQADPDAWDTVSGEPQNWWCDDAGTAMVEDGSLARMVLDGKMTGQQLQALEDGEEA